MLSSWNAGAEMSGMLVMYDGEHFSMFYSERLVRQLARNQTPAREQENSKTKAGECEGTAPGSGDRRHRPASRALGELIGFAKITRDITERNATDAASAGIEDRFRLLVQGVTDYAHNMLPRRLITNWNAGRRRIKGYKRVGNFSSARISPSFLTEESRGERPARKTLAMAPPKAVWNQESWRVRRARKRFWAHVVVDGILRRAVHRWGSPRSRGYNGA